MYYQKQFSRENYSIEVIFYFKISNRLLRIGPWFSDLHFFSESVTYLKFGIGQWDKMKTRDLEKQQRYNKDYKSGTGNHIEINQKTFQRGSF